MGSETKSFKKEDIAFALKSYLNRLKEMGFFCLNKAGERSLSKTEKLEILKEKVSKCTRCVLSRTRLNAVFGEGNYEAELVFVGEAPGEHEDEQGRPFVGTAGNLLTKIIEVMGFKRNEVFICNVIKCRPPENRDPHLDEIASCEPYLIKQLEIIKPKCIVALGNHAAKTLLKTTTPISALRGQWLLYHGIKLMPTFHPASLLYNVNLKRFVWEDMKKVMALFSKTLPPKPSQKK